MSGFVALLCGTDVIPPGFNAACSLVPNIMSQLDIS
jgi:hypothetical protein